MQDKIDLLEDDSANGQSLFVQNYLLTPIGLLVAVMRLLKEGQNDAVIVKAVTRALAFIHSWNPRLQKRQVLEVFDCAYGLAYYDGRKEMISSRIHVLGAERKTSSGTFWVAPRNPVIDAFNFAI